MRDDHFLRADIGGGGIAPMALVLHIAVGPVFPGLTGGGCLLICCGIAEHLARLFRARPKQHSLQSLDRGLPRLQFVLQQRERLDHGFQLRVLIRADRTRSGLLDDRHEFLNRELHSRCRIFLLAHALMSRSRKSLTKGKPSTSLTVRLG